MLDRQKDEETLEESGLLASVIKAKFNFQLCVYLKAAWRATRRREDPLTTETKNKGAF